MHAIRRGVGGGLLVPASYQTFGTVVDPTTNQPWLGINAEKKVIMHGKLSLGPQG